MKKLTIIIGLLITIAATVWWQLLEGTPPTSAPDEFNISLYRKLTSELRGSKPEEVRVEYVGTDVAPGIASETGNFGGEYHAVYTSIQLVWTNKTMIIGGAIDQQSAKEIRQSEKKAVFHQDSYDRIIAAMLDATYVAITHSHPDHVMAVIRHPSPHKLAPKLLLNEQQISALNRYEESDEFSNALKKANIKPMSTDQPAAIAPGVVLIPNPGHSPGSQSFFVTLNNGNEYLLIGDIVWTMSNIENLKTRPRILQHILFDPNEDRAKVLSQVRALHDLHSAEESIVIVPSHDLNYLDSLIKQGFLTKNFTSSMSEP